mmetsp:Transcript_21126/g.31919  ORF Transcript_21126/g.31919 Transcript_21126/m.31919 type:complete len:219 (-) Transcript_21126:1653-2309(-)
MLVSAARVVATKSCHCEYKGCLLINSATNGIPSFPFSVSLDEFLSLSIFLLGSFSPFETMTLYADTGFSSLLQLPLSPTFLLSKRSVIPRTVASFSSEDASAQACTNAWQIIMIWPIYPLRRAGIWELEVPSDDSIASCKTVNSSFTSKGIAASSSAGPTTITLASRAASTSSSDTGNTSSSSSPISASLVKPLLSLSTLSSSFACSFSFNTASCNES